MPFSRGLESGGTIPGRKAGTEGSIQSRWCSLWWQTLRIVFGVCSPRQVMAPHWASVLCASVLRHQCFNPTQSATHLKYLLWFLIAHPLPLWQGLVLALIISPSCNISQPLPACPFSFVTCMMKDPHLLQALPVAYPPLFWNFIPPWGDLCGGGGSEGTWDKVSVRSHGFLSFI